MTLAKYQLVVACQLATPVPASPTGFHLGEIRSMLTGTAQKYCAAIYFQDSILLVHSLFTVGSVAYACTAKGGINGDSYVSFKHSQLQSPVSGLVDPTYFQETVANSR